MKLLIMRHGEAEPGIDDFQRRLTDTGRSDVARMGRFIAGTGWKVGEVRTSPLARTKETGDQLTRSLANAGGGNPRLSEEPRLAPGFAIDDALDIFDELDANSVSIWIFHAPDVMRLAGALTGLREGGFYFTPGSVLALNLPFPRPTGRGMIVWQLQPEYIRALG